MVASFIWANDPNFTRVKRLLFRREINRLCEFIFIFIVSLVIIILIVFKTTLQTQVMDNFLYCTNTETNYMVFTPTTSNLIR